MSGILFAFNAPLCPLASDLSKGLYDVTDLANRILETKIHEAEKQFQ